MSDEALSVSPDAVLGSAACLRSVALVDGEPPALDPVATGVNSADDALGRLAALARNLPVRIAVECGNAADAIVQDRRRGDVLRRDRDDGRGQRHRH